MDLSRRVLALLAVCAAAAGCLLASAPGTAAATPAKPGDYNGDRYPDLAVGATTATVNGVAGAGAVAIVYGTEAGPDTTKRQRLQQGVSWVPGESERLDGFGTSHTSGDFNGDGYSDIAICAPGERRGTDGNGMLMLAFGSATGLNRAYELVPPAEQPVREYCRSLSSADFDSDRYVDIVVGSGEALVAPIQLISGGPEAHHRSKLKVTWIPQTDVSGKLTAGYITGDGYPDLVVGAAFNGPTGGLTLYKGSPDGLVVTPAQHIATPGSSQSAIGDIDGDGFGDVAAANSTVGHSGVTGAGLVRVWYGSSQGLDTARGFILVTQNTTGVPDTAEASDHFGSALAIGDLGNDGYADLVIGSPSEDVGTSARGQNAGSVTVIHGGENGLNFSRTNYLTQDSADVPDTVEADDFFGSDLQVHELALASDGRSHLIAGAASEDGLAESEGAVFVFDPAETGLPGQVSVIGPRHVGITPLRAAFHSLS